MSVNKHKSQTQISKQVPRESTQRDVISGTAGRGLRLGLVHHLLTWQTADATANYLHGTW